jgi:hypothetical protein
MMQSLLGSALVKKGLMNAGDLETIAKNQSPHPAYFARGVVAMGIINDEDLANFVAELSKKERAERPLADKIDRSWFDSLDHQLISLLEFVPLAVEQGRMTVAVVDPSDREHLRKIEFLIGMRIRPVVASISDIHAALTELVPGFEAVMSPFERFITELSESPIEIPEVGEKPAGMFDFDAARSDEGEFQDLSSDSMEVSEPVSDEIEIPNLTDLPSIDGDDTPMFAVTGIPAVEQAVDVINVAAQNVDVGVDVDVDVDVGVDHIAVEAKVDLPVIESTNPDASVIATINEITLHLSTIAHADRAVAAKRQLSEIIPELRIVRGLQSADDPVVLILGWAGDFIEELSEADMNEIRKNLAAEGEVRQVADGRFLLSFDDRAALIRLTTPWSDAYSKPLKRLFRFF